MTKDEILKSGTQKNVLFLVLDSLRYDRLAQTGEQSQPAPFINGLMNNGINVVNGFTAGSPTEFAYPALATSSFPLDYGGYERGISDRPVALSEVFQKEGYQTVSFSDGMFRSLTRYTRGYDELLFVTDINRFIVNFDNTIRYYSKAVRNDDKSLDSCIPILTDYLDSLFEDLSRYCLFMIDSKATSKIPDNPVLFSYSFSECLTIVGKAKESLASSAESFVSQLLLSESGNIYIRDLKRILRQGQLSVPLRAVDRRLRSFFLRAMFHLCKLILQGKVGLRSIYKPMKKLLRGHRRSILFPSAAYMVNTFIHWFDNRSTNKPFFAWLHIMDIHEQNMVSFDIIDNDESVNNEINEIKQYCDTIKGQSKTYRGSPFFDCSVRYVDIQIKRLFAMLKERDLLSDTLIVLTADHGHYSTGWPIRKEDKLARDFYDEYYHVPIAFIGEGIEPARVEGLFSTVDIAPTLLSLLGLPVPVEFKGIVIDPNDEVGRDYVLMEHLGPGPYDIDGKPVRICVRTKSYKLVYLILPLKKGEQGKAVEFYNLDSDPLELVNLIGSGECLDVLENLESIANERFRITKSSRNYLSK